MDNFIGFHVKRLFMYACRLGVNISISGQLVVGVLV